MESNNVNWASVVQLWRVTALTGRLLFSCGVKTQFGTQWQQEGCLNEGSNVILCGIHPCRVHCNMLVGMERDKDGLETLRG